MLLVLCIFSFTALSNLTLANPPVYCKDLVIKQVTRIGRLWEKSFLEKVFLSCLKKATIAGRVAKMQGSPGSRCRQTFTGSLGPPKEATQETGAKSE